MSIFYKSLRIGKHGKPFWMLKIRTMIPNADKVGGPSTSADDPRLTKFGRLLRKFKIDELPQFLNVLKGDMSIVGPRPDVPAVIAAMTNEEKEEILSVRPGVTDLASLWDSEEEEMLRGEPDPHKAYMEKIWPIKKLLQIWYIRNQSLWLDLKIILATALRMLRIKAVINVEEMFPQLLK